MLARCHVSKQGEVSAACKTRDAFAPTVGAPQFELQIAQGSICIRLAILGRVDPETNQCLPTKLLPDPAPFPGCLGAPRSS